MVPRVIRAYVGEAFTYTGDRASFMAKVQSGLETLAQEADTAALFQDGPSRSEHGS